MTERLVLSGCQPQPQFVATILLATMGICLGSLLGVEDGPDHGAYPLGARCREAKWKFRCTLIVADTVQAEMILVAYLWSERERAASFALEFWGFV